MKNNTLTNDAPEPHAILTTITPHLAEKWLGRNVQNRHLSKVKVNEWARKMEEGRWAVTTEALGFDTNGTLVDGQHRLHAVIKTGITIKTFVMYDLEPDARSHINMGKARSAADVLTVNHGTANAAAAAAVSRLILGWREGQRPMSARISPEAIEDFVTGPEMEKVERAASVAKLAKLLPVPPSATGFAYFISAERDVEAAEQFYVEQLIESIGLNHGYPAKALQGWLGRNAELRGNDANDRKIAAMLHAWNRFRSGKSLTSIRVPDSIPEPK